MNTCCSQVHCLVLLANMFKLSLSLYYLNKEDNALTWRNKTQKLEKHWQHYSMHTLQDCVNSFSGIKRTTLTKYQKKLVTCTLAKHLLGIHCRFPKITLNNRTESYYEFFSQCHESIGEQKSYQNEIRGTMFVINMTHPVGQECINIKYSKQGFVLSLNSQNQPVRNTFKIMKIRYKFKMTSFLGLNITFKTFVLSDMCLPHHPGDLTVFSTAKCVDHLDTEYMQIRQYERISDAEQKTKLYFCMKRPQWSVFTDYKTDIDLHICHMCVNYESKVTLHYQVIDSKLMKTDLDEHMNIFYGGNFTLNKIGSGAVFSDTFDPYTISCVLVDSNCSISVLNFYIRAEKYQHIKLSTQLQNGFRLFFLNESDHNIIHKKLNSSDSVASFFCYVQAHVTRKMTNASLHILPVQKLLNYIFLRPETNRLKNILDCASKHMNQSSHCHKVYQMNSTRNTRVKVSIQDMVFAGWKVHSCLYGGLSFHELQGGDEGTKYVEILSLCDNYTGTKDSFFEKETEYIRKIPVGPYVSASAELLIVLHFVFPNVCNVSLEFGLTTCRGVFVNPCYFDTVVPSGYRQDVLHYHDPLNENQTCVVIQLSLQYMHRKLYEPAVIKYGCESVFSMKQSEKQLCGSWVNYLGTFSPISFVQIPFKEYPTKVSHWFFGYITMYRKLKVYNASRTLFMPDSVHFEFVNEITNSTVTIESKGNHSCREDTSDPLAFANEVKPVKESRKWRFLNKRQLQAALGGTEWKRGTQRYNKVINTSNGSAVVHRFTAEVQFVNIHKGMQDVFFLQLQPHSASAVSIALNFFKCQNFSTPPKPSMVTSIPTQESICLRKPVKGVIEMNFVLELSVLGKRESLFQSYSYGLVTMTSSLCLEVRESRQMFQSIHGLFKVCSSNKGAHEYRLTWTSGLTQRLLASSGTGFVIDLPGKIVDATFSAKGSPQSCCEKKSYQLKLQWHKKIPITKGDILDEILDPTKQIFSKLSLRFIGGKEVFQPEASYKFDTWVIFDRFGLSVPSRKLDKNYKEPAERTWYEANKMCNQTGNQLPSIVSHKDIENLLGFITTASSGGLITNFFISIRSKVLNQFSFDCPDQLL